MRRVTPQVEKRFGEIGGVTANVNFATGIASVTAPPAGRWYSARARRDAKEPAVLAPALEEVASCQG